MYHSRVAQVNNIIRKLEDCKTEIEYVARKNNMVDSSMEQNELQNITDCIGIEIIKLKKFVN